MLSILLIVFCAFFFEGIIIRTRSIFSGRKGPSILQPIRDIYVQLHKGNVISKNSSIIFRLAPLINFASVITAMLLIPFAEYRPLISFKGDFIFFCYILALGRFFMIIGALDTASSFEGMGANRDALYGLLIEPVLMVTVASLVMMGGFYSFNEIFSNLSFSTNYSIILGILVFYMITQIILVENSRLPVDDPKTHLELTMVHEVMILDYSGFELAIINITKLLKYTTFGALIANSLISPDMNIIVKLTIFISIIFSLAVIIGFMESFRGRNKMAKNPQYIITISAIAILSFIIVLIMTGKLTL